MRHLDEVIELTNAVAKLISQGESNLTNSTRELAEKLTQKAIKTLDGEEISGREITVAALDEWLKQMGIDFCASGKVKALSITVTPTSGDKCWVKVSAHS